MNLSDNDCRAYLLGRLPEGEAERLEEQLLQDEETFQILRSAEDDLLDDYARGRLGADDRARFGARYGAEPDRVRFAQALKHRVPGRVLAFPAPRVWVPLAAAAALLVAVAIPSLTPEAPAVLAPGLTTPTPPQAAASKTVVALTLATSRAQGAATRVALPADSSTLELHVRLNAADRFDVYAFELRSASNTVVWRDDTLRATGSGGDLMVTAAIPASLLDAGSYELAVRSGPDDLGFVTLEVRRSP